jgi:hypothetical protein
MAKIRGDYVNLGREAFKEVGHKEGADIGIPCSWNGLSVALSGSWQAMAFKEGWQAERDNARRRAAQAVNMAKPLDCPACAAGVPLAAPVFAKVIGGPDDGKVVQLSAKTVQSIARAEVTPAQQRIAERVDAMTRGWIAAALWSTGATTPEGEELENLDDYEFSENAKKAARVICAAFYDTHTIDLGAYAGTYKPSDGSDVWECAGHDLWLTANGHGVGFWDRGLGRLGDRLSADCGFRKQFDQIDLYIAEDGFVNLA